MAITNGYCNLGEIKARLGIDADDTDDDDVLEDIVTAISRAMDAHCGRRFYAVTETRYYTAEQGGWLPVDDLLAVTSLQTDRDGDRSYGDTWATDDYDLVPYNAALEGKPYTQIEATPDADYSFPTVRKGVKVAGSFGYAATAPAAIKEGCLLLSEQLWKRKDAIFGVVGTMGGEQLMAMAKRLLESDPHLQFLLTSFMRLYVGGI